MSRPRLYSQAEVDKLIRRVVKTVTAACKKACGERARAIIEEAKRLLAEQRSEHFQELLNAVATASAAIHASEAEAQSMGKAFLNAMLEFVALSRTTQLRVPKRHKERDQKIIDLARQGKTSGQIRILLRPHYPQKLPRRR